MIKDVKSYTVLLQCQVVQYYTIDSQQCCQYVLPVAVQLHHMQKYIQHSGSIMCYLEQSMYSSLYIYTVLYV